ncbi:MAG: ATP-dependent DNA helicase RecG, partial [Calditrichaeota bacterium]|nr:ATP-dependent DNA helicase RecG [Calditrichota bacterium]
GIRFEKLGEHFHSIHDGLHFELTEAQKRVLKEIRRDTMAPFSMNRLVQGDVGSGKTIVAILTIAIAADNGYQSAFMAPTEILAEQHYLNLLKLTDLAGLRVTFLSGSLKESQRKERLQSIANGMTDVVVGTHAVIQKNVRFQKLGMVVIDEQHRFGVMQRAELLEKGDAPDVLVMTATPIPRTLALTVYGDLDVSVIDEMPKGRVPIKTLWRYDNKEAEIHQFITQRLEAGEQAYIVYPLIEESEKIDIKSAIEQFERISTGVYKKYRLALLHGRMKAEEKEDVMRRFKAGEIQAIISTTVIEVGVDVPNATVMLIENAERFGLSQLHQLRGRVGRGSKQSYCILKTSYRIGDDAKERMQIMVDHLDGFKIAEEDLRLRGIGELFGTRQSGISDLRMANLATDQDWLMKARAEAEHILQEDPHLRKAEHSALRQIVMTDYQQRFGLIEIA